MTKQMKYSAGIEQIPEGYKLEYGYILKQEDLIEKFIRLHRKAPEIMAC